MLSATGKPSQALRSHEAARAIFERLARDNPTMTRFQGDLALSHNNIGVLLSVTGKPAEALRSHGAARTIFERLARDNPKVLDYLNVVARCHTDAAVALRRLGRPAEARDACAKAIALREALVREVPGILWYRSELAGSLRRRSLARSDLGDLTGAAADARRAIALWDGLPSRAGSDWFETACAHAALAGLAGSGVSADEGVAEAGAAMDLLRKAVAMGYRRLDTFRTDDALDPLRSRNDFRLLMMDLAFPAHPIADAPAGR